LSTNSELVPTARMSMPDIAFGFSDSVRVRLYDEIIQETSRSNSES
jgi:hypothetical protein